MSLMIPCTEGVRGGNGGRLGDRIRPSVTDYLSERSRDEIRVNSGGRANHDQGPPELPIMGNGSRVADKFFYPPHLSEEGIDERSANQ
jgi:hypothetical protein